MTNRDYLNLKNRIKKHFDGAQQDILLQLLDRQIATDKAFMMQARFNDEIIKITNQLDRLVKSATDLTGIVRKIMVHVGMIREEDSVDDSEEVVKSEA